MGLSPSKQSTEEMKTGATLDVRQFIQNENAQHQVVIWSKAYCPYCTRAKQLFQSTIQPKPEDVVIYELDTMSNGTQIQNELLALTGQRTVPNIFVHNQHVGGNDDVQQKYRTGELQTMMLPK
jgi:glutaredoxin 3